MNQKTQMKMVLKLKLDMSLMVKQFFGATELCMLDLEVL